MRPKKPDDKKHYHWHHIIPKYMGGSDDPTNLVLLSPLEHAHAHLQRYEEFKNHKDLYAAKILMGSLGENGFPVDMTGIPRENPVWNKGLTKDDPRVAKCAANYPKNRAKRLPDDRGLKISEALIGRKLSDDHRAVMRTQRANQKWINKDGVCKLLRGEYNLQEFIDDGWNLGRK